MIGVLILVVLVLIALCFEFARSERFWTRFIGSLILMIGVGFACNFMRDAARYYENGFYDQALDQMKQGLESGKTDEVITAISAHQENDIEDNWISFKRASHLAGSTMNLAVSDSTKPPDEEKPTPTKAR